MQGFGFSCFDADIGMPWAASHRISHDACCWVWDGCCTAGLALSTLMAVPSGLGLPVLRWSRSRLWRGSGIRWTGIVSPLPVRPVRHPRATPGSDTAGHRAPPTSGDIGRAYGCGFRRYRIRRVHARRHRYQAGRHASDIDSGSRGTRGLPISIPRPATDIDG